MVTNGIWLGRLLTGRMAVLFCRCVMVLPGLKGDSEVQGMKTLTKKDLIDFVNEKFADKRDDEPVASFFYCSDGHNAAQQQCILFREAVENK